MIFPEVSAPRLQVHFLFFLPNQRVAPYFHDDLRLLLMFTRICKVGLNIHPRYKTRQTRPVETHLSPVVVVVSVLQPPAEETHPAETFTGRFCFLVFSFLPPLSLTLLEVISNKRTQKESFIRCF